MKENKRIEFNDEEEVIVPPYYSILYIDDQGRKHLATVKDIAYIEFLKDRFIVVECKFIKA